MNIWVCLLFSSCAKYLVFTNIQERLSRITFSTLSIENNLLNTWARHWQSVAIARRWYPPQPAPWARLSDRPTFLGTRRPPQNQRLLLARASQARLLRITLEAVEGTVIT